MDNLFYVVAPFLFAWRVYETLTTDPHATLNFGGGSIGAPGSLLAFNWAMIGFYLFAVSVAALRSIVQMAAKFDKISN